jgi:hypothetical protein
MAAQGTGGKRAGSITKSDLTQYILDRRAAGAAESSIKKDLQLLGQAYNLQTAVPKPQFPQDRSPPFATVWLRRVNRRG